MIKNMKKTFKFLAAFCLTLTTLTFAPTYAEEISTPEQPVNIDDYSIRAVSGKTSFTFSYLASDLVMHQGAVFISASGTLTLDANKKAVSSNLSYTSTPGSYYTIHYSTRLSGATAIVSYTAIANQSTTNPSYKAGQFVVS